jgi:hypothetical protein
MEGGVVVQVVTYLSCGWLSWEFGGMQWLGRQGIEGAGKVDSSCIGSGSAVRRDYMSRWFLVGRWCMALWDV